MANSPTTASQSAPRTEERRLGECPPDNELPENSQANLDEKLDHAIEETFPTSDPVSVLITKAGAHSDTDQETGPSAAPGIRDEAEQELAENLLDQVRETLRDVMEHSSESAHEAYSQGKRYVRQARENFPEAERYYREGRRAVSQRAMEHPWLSLLAAGAVGYALAWMIHGMRQNRDEGLSDYARTQQGYAPHRDRHE